MIDVKNDEPTQPAYPSGPYGLAVGDTVSNVTVNGYARPAQGLGPDALADISMEDFFNPGGDQSYAADSPFEAGSPKPVALVLQLNSMWIPPSVVDPELTNQRYEDLRGVGGEMLMVLAESINPGEPADIDNLNNWLEAFGSEHPSAVDPDYIFGGQLPSSEFPTTLLIDTRDMTVQERVAGIPQDSFWSAAKTLAAQ